MADEFYPDYSKDPYQVAQDMIDSSAAYVNRNQQKPISGLQGYDVPGDVAQYPLRSLAPRSNDTTANQYAQMNLNHAGLYADPNATDGNALSKVIDFAGQYIGMPLINLAEMALSPLTSVSNATLAPLAHEYENNLFDNPLDFAREAWDASNEGAVNAFQAWGERGENYGYNLANRLFPNMSEMAKVSTGMVLSLLTDPLILTGLGFAKTLKFGVQSSRAAARAGQLTTRGIVENAVMEFLLVTPLVDRAEMAINSARAIKRAQRAELSALAKRADRGDTSAIKTLDEMFEEPAMRELADDVEQRAQTTYRNTMEDAYGEDFSTRREMLVDFYTQRHRAKVFNDTMQIQREALIAKGLEGDALHDELYKMQGRVAEFAKREPIPKDVKKQIGDEIGRVKAISDVIEEQFQNFGIVAEGSAYREFLKLVKEQYGPNVAKIFDTYFDRAKTAYRGEESAIRISNLRESLQQAGIKGDELNRRMADSTKSINKAVAKAGIPQENLNLYATNALRAARMEYAKGGNAYVTKMYDATSERGNKALAKLISQKQIHRALSPNIENYTKENTKDAIQALFEGYSELFQHLKKRHAYSFDEVVKDSSKVTFEEILGTDFTDKNWTAEQFFAALNTQRVLYDEVSRLAEAVIRTAEPHYSQAFDRAMNLYMQLSSQVSKGASGWSGAGAAQRWFYQISDKTGEEISKRAKDIRSAREAIDGIAGMQDIGADKRILLMARKLKEAEKMGMGMRFLKASMGAVSKGEDAIYEMYVNSILSAVSQVTTNVVSTGSFTLAQPFERLLDVPIKGRAAIEEAGQMFIGLAEGFREGLTYYRHEMGEAKDAVAKLLPGQTIKPEEAVQATRARLDGIRAKYPLHYTSDVPYLKENIARFAHEAQEINSRRAISSTNFGLQPESISGRIIDKTGWFLRLPGTAFRQTDTIFKFMGHRMGVRVKALQDAKAAGLTTKKDINEYMTKVLADPSSKVEEAGIEMANYVTFQTQLQGKLRQSQLLFQNRFFRWFFPFYRTPVNLVLRSAERLPGLGHAVALKRLLLDQDPAKAYQAMSRATAGAGVMIALANMIDEDMVVGDYNYNSPYGRKMAALGIAPNSIKWGDHWVSFKTVDFLKNTIGMLANYRRVMASLDLTDPEDISKAEQIATAVTVAGTNAIVFKPWVDQFSRLIYYFDQMAGEKGGLKEVAKAEGRRIGSGLVPFSSFARDFKRTFVDDELKMTDSLIQSVMNTLPGLGADLPPYRDLWGDPLIASNAFGPDLHHKLVDFVSPEKVSPVDRDMVTKEILSLPIEFPPPRANISGVKLTKAQRSQVQFYTGKGVMGEGDLKLDFMKVMMSPEYALATEVGRSSLLLNAYNRKVNRALNQIVQDSAMSDPSSDALHNKILRNERWKQAQLDPTVAVY